MRKKLFTLIACMAALFSAHAQTAGDFVYTKDGRYMITTGVNLMANSQCGSGLGMFDQRQSGSVGR